MFASRIRAVRYQHRCALLFTILAINVFLSSTLDCSSRMLLSASPSETPEAQELSALEPKVVYLCEEARFQASPQMRAYWVALSNPSFNTANLIALLKNPDPKIRSLAIFALARKDDPHLLAEIAPLQSDQAASYRCPLPVQQALPPDKPESWPSEAQTVGNLAYEVVHHYLEVSGQSNFSDYWAHYRDRKYSVAWFTLELMRAWDPFDPTRPDLDSLRNQVALSPAPDRQWTVLCLGTISNFNPRVAFPYDEQEVLRAASELGHDPLIRLLKGEIQSSDPALAFPASSSLYDPYWERLQRMQIFVLLHAKDLLRTSDADLLLDLARPEKNPQNSRKANYQEWWAIAAASLRPQDSTAILDEAEKRWPKSANVPLARWRIQGRASLPSVLGWFYQSAQWGQGRYGPQESLVFAIEHARPNSFYEPLVRSILSSSQLSNINGPAMSGFEHLSNQWHADFDSALVDWIYAQVPDAHPEYMGGTPRGIVVRISGVARKLVRDPRFANADAQLLYDIEQAWVGHWKLSRSESARIDRLISRIDLKNPQKTSASDQKKIRKLLLKGARDR